MSLADILDSSNRNTNWKSLQVNTIQSINQPLSTMQITNVTANPYNVTTSDMIGSAIYIGSGSATASITLPSVANLKTFLQSQNVSFSVSNASFKFQVINNKGSSITITNGGDTNWSFATALASSSPYTLAANTSVAFTVVVGTSATGFLLA